MTFELNPDDPAEPELPILRTSQFDYHVTDGAAALVDGNTIYYGRVFGARIHDASFLVHQVNDKLTERQTKIALLGSLGLTTKEIGRHMRNTAGAIAHVQSAIQKTYREDTPEMNDSYINFRYTVGWLFRQGIFVAAEHTRLLGSLSTEAQKTTLRTMATDTRGEFRIDTADRSRTLMMVRLRNRLYVRSNAALSLLWHLSDEANQQ